MNVIISAWETARRVDNGRLGFMLPRRCDKLVYRQRKLLNLREYYLNQNTIFLRVTAKRPAFLQWIIMASPSAASLATRRFWRCLTKLVDLFAELFDFNGLLLKLPSITRFPP
jgi:hypothetical protein